MKNPLVRIAAAVACVAAMLVVMQGSVRASDHADPMILQAPNSNITGLFFFPEGDQMILILNVRRALTAAAPYDLAGIDFVVHMDLHDAGRQRLFQGQPVPQFEQVVVDRVVPGIEGTGQEPGEDLHGQAEQDHGHAQ